MVFLSIIFNIILNVFNFVNSGIKMNPIIKDNELNMLYYYISFDNYIAQTFTVSREIKIYEENDLFLFNEKSYMLSPNMFICKNQNNNEYLFADNYLYKISNDSHGIKSLSFYKEVNSDCIYYGYIKKQNTPAYPNGEKNPPQKYNQNSISDESIILYGINDKSICFYFSENDKTVQISPLAYEINNISCNFLDYTKYLCAIDQNNEIKVITLELIIQETEIKELKYIDTKSIFPNSYSDKIILYDTDKGSRYKILCANNRQDNKVSCIIINIRSNDFKIIFGNFTNYDIKFSINSDNCYMTKFWSEFLLCCGIDNKISCQRKNMAFETINDFTICLTGEIYNLTISNYISHAVLSYMNSISEPFYLNEYYIYPPECPNFSNVLSDFKEGKLILFEKKTNTNYYITFINLPFEFGVSMINGNIINGLAQMIEIKDDVANFNFICFCDKKDELPSDLKIIYNISISETYSTKCEIPFQTEFCSNNCLNNNNSGEKCNENYYIFNGYCLLDCPINTYKFSFNYTCLTSCPNNYEINNEQRKCLINSFDETTSSTEFKSQISDNILSFTNSSSLINGSDFIAVILSSDDLNPENQIHKGISAVDLGSCEQTLRLHYNISENESLIILNMESKRNQTKNEENNDNSFNLGKVAQVEVYDFQKKT